MPRGGDFPEVGGGALYRRQNICGIEPATLRGQFRLCLISSGTETCGRAVVFQWKMTSQSPGRRLLEFAEPVLTGTICNVEATPLAINPGD